VDELGLLRDIERLIKREIKKDVVPGSRLTAHQGRAYRSGQARRTAATPPFQRTAQGRRQQPRPECAAPARNPRRRRNSRDSGRRAFAY